MKPTHTKLFLNLVICLLYTTGTYAGEFINSKTHFAATITSFQAVSSGSSVDIQWISLSEENTNAFVLEYSIDGINWIQLNVITATGSANAKATYNTEHTDAPVVKNIYYRLQTSNDSGDLNPISEIITVQHDSETIAATNNQLYYNLSGKVFSTLENAPSGIYISVKGNEKHKIYLTENK